MTEAVTISNISPTAVAQALIEDLVTKVGTAKKADIPAIVQEYGQALTDLVYNVVEGPAVATRVTGSLTKNKQTTDLPEAEQSWGTAKTGQVKRALTLGLTMNMGNFESARIDGYSETYGDDTEDGFGSAMEDLKTMLGEEMKKFVVGIKTEIKERAEKKSTTP